MMMKIQSLKNATFIKVTAGVQKFSVALNLTMTPNRPLDLGM
jgi:hypothetical protein